MYAFIGVVFAVFLIVTVVLPILKRKRCTKPVVARISNQKYWYVGKVGRIKGRMTYTYKNQAVVRDIFIPSKSTVTKEILINPDKPEEWVDKSWNSFYGRMILGIAIVVVSIVMVCL